MKKCAAGLNVPRTRPRTPRPEGAGPASRLPGAFVVALLLLSGCASPPEGLWPPADGAPTLRIVVSSDAWHSRIAIPSPDGGYEEWGYGERAWYYEGRQGFFGALRALFWPTAGVLDLRRTPVPYARRLPPGEGRMWTFTLSREGAERLRAYVARSRSSETPIGPGGGAVWYPARRRYHAFHTCHHGVANALWEAGLPVRAACCWIPQGLWMQLDGLQPRDPSAPEDSLQEDAAPEPS